ncbi:MAG TPA: tRNA uridine-5-carboxymethylaminomethyl(34) synthesis enzyme MnmG, partial [Gammaproteobacteria bacterium]|nr:tRNA uridine-5-carboxymethylaminomethyl(34) synthesis enzyme MnmG [Gammaproteobacteria bacterium]
EARRFTPRELSAAWIAEHLGEAPADSATAWQLLARPKMSYAAIAELAPAAAPIAADVAALLEAEAHYGGYLKRQSAEVLRLRARETLALPGDFDYAKVRGLSNEVREKLAAARPATLGQAARIPGVTPAAVSLLLVHLSAAERARVARG